MKKLLSIWLILMSLFWVHQSFLKGHIARTQALSSALQLEADLHAWASQNTSHEARSEIFDENGALLLGGEHPTWTFREMIEGIAMNAIPPIWPGIIGLVLGVTGLFWRRTSSAPRLQNSPTQG